jgi:hypothetical protein
MSYRNTPNIFNTGGKDLRVWLQENGVKVNPGVGGGAFHPKKLYFWVQGSYYPELVKFLQENYYGNGGEQFPTLVFERMTGGNSNEKLYFKPQFQSGRFIGYGPNLFFELPPINYDLVKQSLASLNTNINSKIKNTTLKYNRTLKSFNDQLERILKNHKNNIEKYPTLLKNLNNIAIQESQFTKSVKNDTLKKNLKQWYSSYGTTNNQRKRFLNKYAKSGWKTLTRSKNQRLNNAITAKIAEAKRVDMEKMEAEKPQREKLNANKKRIIINKERIKPIYNEYSSFKRQSNDVKTLKNMNLKGLTLGRVKDRKELEALQSIAELNFYKQRFAKYDYTYVPASQGRTYQTSMIGYETQGKAAEGFQYKTSKSASKNDPDQKNGWTKQTEKKVEKGSGQYGDYGNHTYEIFTYTRPLPPGYPEGLIPREEWDAALAKLDSLNSAK